MTAINSRRSFLKIALAAGAAPAIVPAGVVRAQEGRPTPANRTTFALIGCGNMGPSGVFHNVIKNKDVQVIAMCDVFKSRREARAKQVDDIYKTAGCAAVGDFRELLARQDLDCVEIATADHWHVPLAIHAVRSGKDVYVEKPLGVALNWARILRDEVTKRKAVFQFGTWQRSERHFRRACEMVHNGVIGKVRRVEAWAPGMNTHDKGGVDDPNSVLRKMHLEGLKPQTPPADLDYDMWLGPAPAAFYSPERVTPDGCYHISDYALGFIAGWNIHSVDIAQWGLGADGTVPVAYTGTCQRPPVDGLFDTVSAWDVACRYESGVELRLMDWKTAQPVIAAYRPDCNHGTTFFGEKGWISVNRGAVYVSDKAWKWDKIEWGEKDVKLFASAADNQWHGFIDSVRTRKPTVNPIESAFNGDLVCMLANLACTSGREIRWDAKAEKLVGNDDLAMMLERTARAPWKVEPA
jgi:predicted dehydrogenase